MDGTEGLDAATERPGAENIVSHWDSVETVIDLASTPTNMKLTESIAVTIPDTTPEPEGSEPASAPIQGSTAKSAELVSSRASVQKHKSELAPAPMKRSRSRSKESVFSNANPKPRGREPAPAPIKRSRSRSKESVFSNPPGGSHDTEPAQAPIRRSRLKSKESVFSKAPPKSHETEPARAPMKRSRLKTKESVFHNAPVESRKTESVQTPIPRVWSRNTESGQSVASEVQASGAIQEVTEILIAGKPTPLEIAAPNTLEKNSLKRSLGQSESSSSEPTLNSGSVPKIQKAHAGESVSVEAASPSSTLEMSSVIRSQPRAHSDRAIIVEETLVRSRLRPSTLRARQSREQNIRAITSDVALACSTPASTRTAGRSRAKNSRAVASDAAPALSTQASSPIVQSHAKNSPVVDVDGTAVPSTPKLASNATQTKALSSRAVGSDFTPELSAPATAEQSRAESLTVSPEVVSAMKKRPKDSAIAASNKKSKSAEPPIILDADAPLPMQALNGTTDPASSSSCFVCIKGIVYQGATLVFEREKLVCKLPDGSDYFEDPQKVIGIFRLKEHERCYWIKLPNTRKGGIENRAILFYSLKLKHPEMVKEVLSSNFKSAVMSHPNFLSWKSTAELTRGWNPTLWENAWGKMVSIIRNKPFVETPASSSSTPISASADLVPRDRQRSVQPRLLSADRPRRMAANGSVSKASPEPRGASAPASALSKEVELPEDAFLQLDNAQLFKGDISRLRSGEFLNDACINFFVKFLQVFLVPKFDHMKKKFFAFTTHFFSRLIAFDAINGETGHANVPRWTKALQKEVGSAGLFTQDLIAIPINQSNIHWWLALIMLPALGDTKVAIDPGKLPELDSRAVRASTPKASAETTHEGTANGSRDVVGEKPEPKEALASAPASESLEKDGTTEGAENEEQGETNAEKAEGDDEVDGAEKDGDAERSSALPEAVASEDAEVATLSPHTGPIVKGETDARSSVALLDGAAGTGNTELAVPSASSQAAPPQAVDDGDVKVMDSQRKEEEEERLDLSNHPGPVVLLLDSAAEQPAEENIYAAEYIKGYLRREWFICGQTTDFDTSKIAVQKVKTPKQRNGVDCGVFVLEYLIRFIHDPTLLRKVLTADATQKAFEFSQERCTKRRDQLRLCAHKMVLEAIKTKRSDVRELISHNPTLLNELCALLFAEKPTRRESTSASVSATDRAHRLPTPIAPTRPERLRASAPLSNTSTASANTRPTKSVAQFESAPEASIATSENAGANPGEFYSIKGRHEVAAEAVASPSVNAEVCGRDESVETVELSLDLSQNVEDKTGAIKAKARTSNDVGTSQPTRDPNAACKVPEMAQHHSGQLPAQNEEPQIGSLQVRRPLGSRRLGRHDAAKLATKHPVQHGAAKLATEHPARHGAAKPATERAPSVDLHGTIVLPTRAQAANPDATVVFPKSHSSTMDSDDMIVLPKSHPPAMDSDDTIILPKSHPPAMGSDDTFVPPKSHPRAVDSDDTIVPLKLRAPAMGSDDTIIPPKLRAPAGDLDTTIVLPKLRAPSTASDATVALPKSPAAAVDSDDTIVLPKSHSPAMDSENTIIVSTPRAPSTDSDATVALPTSRTPSTDSDATVNLAKSRTPLPNSNATSVLPTSDAAVLTQVVDAKKSRSCVHSPRILQHSLPSCETTPPHPSRSRSPGKTTMRRRAASNLGLTPDHTQGISLAAPCRVTSPSTSRKRRRSVPSIRQSCSTTSHLDASSSSQPTKMHDTSSQPTKVHDVSTQPTKVHEVSSQPTKVHDVSYHVDTRPLRELNARRGDPFSSIDAGRPSSPQGVATRHDFSKMSHGPPMDYEKQVVIHVPETPLEVRSISCSRPRLRKRADCRTVECGEKTDGTVVRSSFLLDG